MNNILFPTGGKDTGRDPYWVYGLWFRGLGFRGSGFRAGILVHVLGRGHHSGIYTLLVLVRTEGLTV